MPARSRPQYGFSLPRQPTRPLPRLLCEASAASVTSALKRPLPPRLRFTDSATKTRRVESQLNLWMHLLAFAVYTGATVALLAMGLPAIMSEREPVRRAQLAAAVLRVYDPLSIGALGVSIMTGAFSLTAYKAALRAAFFDRMGGPLAWKLFFTFVLVNLAAYIAFGIGHRVVRAVDGGTPPDAVQLAAFLRRLRTSAMLALVLIAIIVWVAMGLSTAAVLPVSSA